VGKVEERGERLGDGGDFVEEDLLARLVELVEGLSLPLLVSLRMPRKALYTDARDWGGPIEGESEKVAEFIPTRDASVDFSAFWLNI
jgi:hypothetical protein